MTETFQNRERKIISLLEEYYPSFKGGLVHYSSPFQLLVAAILSAQSTDKQVNAITKELFSKFPDPQSFSSSSLLEIEQAIASVGLYKNKARFIYNLSLCLIQDYNSEVPTTLDELVKLPGIGRKTANVLLNDWFEIHEGIAVDTHVKRISFRLGFTKNTNPEKIEKNLMEIVPQDKWGCITHLLISHGRAICKAQKPKCNACFLLSDCPRKGVIEK
ncbi:MAG: endonuclease III [Candidatus Heimdallarchaeota archaeon]|nr:endonuclease III [Candidatus Heimdallarchaeota archaeon]MCK4955866.1 endonuclease III [Candidatus Heimdallarchaeota archaeon]